MTTRSRIFVIALGYAAPIAALACVVQLSRQSTVPLHRLLRDPLAVTDASPLIGAVSNLGIVCWSAAMGVALFLSCLPNTSAAARRFFRGFGGLTLLLVMDDLFQIDEDIFPKYVGPEQWVLATYGVLATLLLLCNRRFILSHAYGHLVAALAFFAVSLAVDARDPAAADATAFLIEDGAKLLGIVAWTMFIAAVGVAEVNGRSAIATAQHPAGATRSPGMTGRQRSGPGKRAVLL